MNVFSPTHSTVRAAAVAAAVGFVAIAAFEVALAVGAPWGHAAWGGAHAELSTAQRGGSAVAILVWTIAAVIVLGRSGLWGAGHLVRVFRWGSWFLVAASAIAALLNFASQSRWENLIFGPTALILTVLCAIVARGGPTNGGANPKSPHEPAS
jgi:hypothetical protein